MNIPEGSKIIKPQEGGQERFVRSNVDVCFFGGILGGGKEQPLDSHVLTPKGWVTMGDITVGSIVMTPFDGEAKVTDVFPQGVKDIYRVTTSDGRTCECGLEHLWTVRTESQIDEYENGGKIWGNYSTVKTKDIIEMMNSFKCVWLPINNAIPFKNYNDGARALSNIDLGTSTYIPNEILFGSISIRKKIFLKIFREKGCAADLDIASFFMKDNRFSDDFISLCRGLGYIAHKFKEGDFCKIFVYHGEDYDHVKIVSIEKVRQAEAQCILIDSPKHLYITDDYITTHNTFGSILGMAEPTLDPNFRAIFIRKSLNDLKTAGSVVDSFKDAYGGIINVKVSENPRMTFPSGAYIEARQVQNEDPKKIIEEWKGVQADALCWEELTSYSWHTFSYIMSRCRGRAKWSGKVRATLNPKKRHWVRKWLDWYIDPITGYVIPERDGVVRFYYLNGDNVEDLVWGDTKKEVYYKCKIDIDRKISKLGGDVKYEDLIKSFTFYKGSLAENKELLKNSPGYVGSVVATGGKKSQILIEGNWNVDEDDDSESPIPAHAARAIFEIEPMTNGDRWITADLADKGTDNFLAIVWDGLHVMDIIIKGKTTPRENAEMLHEIAVRYDISDNHIIFDGNNAAYINDYIPEAVPFVSYKIPRGMYARKAASLKDESYLRLVYLINNELISFDPKVANRIYYHQKMKEQIPISTEFVEECSVVRFKDQPSGKKRLFGKHEMNLALGKGRSMDLLDPMAMRMYPLCMYEYGSELESTMGYEREEEDEMVKFRCRNNVNIYDESTWA